MSRQNAEFDFAEWLATSWPRRSTRDCVRSAANALATGREDIRARVLTALAILSLADGRDIPAAAALQFGELRRESERRAGPDIDLRRLRHSMRRCARHTAQRIALMILELDRALVHWRTGQPDGVPSGE